MAYGSPDGGFLGEIEASFDIFCTAKKAGSTTPVFGREAVKILMGALKAKKTANGAVAPDDIRPLHVHRRLLTASEQKGLDTIAEEVKVKTLGKKAAPCVKTDKAASVKKEQKEKADMASTMALFGL